MCAGEYTHVFTEGCRLMLGCLPTSKHLFICVFVCLLQGCGCALGGQRITFGHQSSLSATWVCKTELISLALKPYIFWIRVSHWRSLLFWLDWLARKLLGSACLCPQVLRPLKCWNLEITKGNVYPLCGSWGDFYPLSVSPILVFS